MAASTGAIRHKNLPPVVVAELLHPPCWSDVLGTLARTIGLGVGLTDSEGRLLGDCQNPQPVWRMARGAQPEPNGVCSFCLSPEVPCAAVTQALASGRIVTVSDGIGMAHVAIPLILGDRQIGALVAGQVFDEYPELLGVQRVAKDLGIPAGRMWQAVIGQTAVSRFALDLYGELLQTMGQAFLRQRCGAIVERKLNLIEQRIRLLNDCLKEPEGSYGRNDDLRFLATMEAGSVHDISRDRNPGALFELKKRNSLATMAGAAARDLHSLLHGIVANASSILDDTDPPDDTRRRLLEDILRAGGAAAGATSELLASTGKEHFVSTRFDLSELIAKMRRQLRLSLAIQVDLQSDLAQGLPSIEGDASQIERLVMNLVTRGGEAIGPEGGVVRVTTGIAGPVSTWEDQPSGASVYLQVEDNGHGLDEAVCARLFDANFVSQFPERGLAEVAAIIRAHEGKVEVRSTPGKGSTFRITFPAPSR